MRAIEARVTILVGVGVGWAEYGRALELITEVWDFVQVFGNLQVLSVLTASSLKLYSSQVLPSHHQNCNINLYFYLSPRHSSTHMSSLFVFFQSPGKLRA